MSKDKSDNDASPKRAKRLIVRLLVGTGLLAVGGGCVFGLVQAGVLPTVSATKGDNRPKLVRKEDNDPYPPPPALGKDGSAMPDIQGDGGSAYRTNYFSFAEEFTSNLRESDALVQASLAASTRHDGRVLIWLRKHELALRSALLAILADTPEEEIYTVEGKQRLQKRMTGAINRVLIEAEGFGGVDAVYFRTLIIQ